MTATTAAPSLAAMYRAATTSQLIACLNVPQESESVRRRMRIDATSELRRRARVRAEAATDADLIEELLAVRHVSEDDLVSSLAGIACVQELEKRHPRAVDAVLEWEQEHQDEDLAWYAGIDMLIEAIRGE